jgi:hypothetical protein
MTLVTLMFLSCFTGCGKKNQEQESEENTTAASTEASNPYDVHDNLGDLTFGTKESPTDFVVLQWDSYDPDWCIDPEITESSVGEELYLRQLYMEDRFKIAFSFVESSGKHGGIAAFNEKIETSILNGLQAYDLAGHYSTGASLLITNGYAKNLLEVKNLDLSRTYWPQDLLGANVVNNQLYFLSGYLAPSYFGNIACVFYNQNTISAMSYQDPVDLVDSNEWTFDKLKEMAVGLYDDNNDSLTVDRDDTFGLVFNMKAAPIDALSIACGVKLMDIGSDGRLRLSPTCYNTKGLGVMNYLTKLINENDAVFIDSDYGNDFGGVFAGGRSLFLVDQFNNIRGYMDKASFTIGVVPVPKYETTQERYYSSIGPQYTMFTIPANAKNSDMSGALLEALESYSYRELFPVLYEENFKLQYSKDSDMSRMVTLIYESVSLDPAKTWGDAADIYWVTRTSLCGGDSWSTRLGKLRETTWNGQIEKLNKYLFHEE